MRYDLLISLERLTWLREFGDEKIVIELPEDKPVVFQRRGQAPIGDLILPDCLRSIFHRQFSGSYDTWPWERFDEIVEWLTQTFMTDNQKVEQSKWLETEEELRSILSTDNQTIVIGRRFQQKLRDLLIKARGGCEISGIPIPRLLVASHIVPWAECTLGGAQRLDPQNVLLLARNWDALFDEYFISFEPTTGSMLKSERMGEDVLRKFGAPENWNETIQIDVSNERRRGYLSWHNEKMREIDAQYCASGTQEALLC